MAVSSNALIIGGGGREHTFGVMLADDYHKVFFAPGNAGTASISNGENIELSEARELIDFAINNNVALVVVGPEDPLVKGYGDQFRAAGLAVVGPSRAAAQLEGSKGFAVDFMEKYQIPYPRSWQFDDLAAAKAFAKDKLATDLVVKADGLCAGKGVILPADEAELNVALEDMLSGSLFGEAGRQITIQERLSGPEVSLFALSDGENLVILPTAQDHKRLKDADQGPNTGGMGAYCPVPRSILSDNQYQKIVAIAEKTFAGMKAEGTPYQGILYIGAMLAKERGGDPVVIEYNVRFGDPEAQVVLPLLRDSGVNVAELFQKLAVGELDSIKLNTHDLNRSALTICLAAPGYPAKPEKGNLIQGLDNKYNGARIFHGGTKLDADGSFVVNGGRVLYITASGQTIDEAAAKAYAVIGENGIHFDGMQYRQDIGRQARQAAK